MPDLKELSIGDLVKLKSGGPLMTVSSLHGDDIYACWFNKDGHADSGVFRRSMLLGPIKRVCL